MVALALHPDDARMDFLKWVSERNTHISMEMLQFLIDIPELPDDDFAGEDDDWDLDVTLHGLVSPA